MSIGHEQRPSQYAVFPPNSHGLEYYDRERRCLETRVVWYEKRTHAIVAGCGDEAGMDVEHNNFLQEHPRHFPNLAHA